MRCWMARGKVQGIGAEAMADLEMRIGIDLGGTKIEALAIGGDGVELMRYRIDTPRDDYFGTVRAMASLVTRIEEETGAKGTVGAGIPGTISGRTGLVKNANSTWLNGQPLQKDLSDALGRPVRIANDANCLAVSEATDGAAAGKEVVFAVILGTGCGGGVAISGQVHGGPNGVGGEWGHMQLPWARGEQEYPGPECYCGARGCMEKWVSGTGFARDYAAVTGETLSSKEIMEAFERGDESAVAAVDRYDDRLARGLAQVINILDPDIFVFGGGMSKVQRIYQELPGRVQKYVFGREAETPMVAAKYGDSSGVRGAAWLWPSFGGGVGRR